MTKHFFIGYARFAEACYVDEETVDVVNGSHKDWPGQGETTKKHISSDIDIKILSEDRTLKWLVPIDP